MTAPQAPRAPHVLLVGLGGTIAMGRQDAGGAVPSLTAAQLLDAVPDLAATGVVLDVVDLRQVPGASLGFGDLDDILRLVAERDADGFVVTQGTDTIEETAYYLDLRHTGAEPIVVTGAMRNPTLAGNDGPANLLAAVQVAASPSACGRGCLVVLADDVHAARRVRKTHTTSLTTFRSPDHGPVGHVVEGRPWFAGAPGRRFVAPPAVEGAPPPRVGLVTVTLGDGAALVDGMVDRYDGLVVAAMGAGHVPADMVAPLEALAEQVPVVLASRAGAGPVLAGTYAFPGSESDLRRRGLLGAGWLHPHKARVLLHVLLGAGLGRDEVAAAVAEAAERSPG